MIPTAPSHHRSVDRNASTRRPIAVVVIVLLHVLGWGSLLLLVMPNGVTFGTPGADGMQDAAQTRAPALLAFGVGATAYALGLRHAFDADHIAAIDNTTRRLTERGRPASTVGLWFSLGHSSVVFLLCLLLTVGVSALGPALGDEESPLRIWTGIIGPTVSGVFLLLIAAVNTRSLISAERTRQREVAADPTGRDSADGRHAHTHTHHTGGPIAWVLRQFDIIVDRPSRMYLVGLLFGLGFDTATEIGLIVLAGTAGVAHVPWWAVLTLPVLFAAGMSALDTAQGAVMRRAYDWAPDRRRRIHLSQRLMVGFSVVAAVTIGVVELAGVVSSTVSRSFSSSLIGGSVGWVARLHVDDLGIILTGLLLATWAMLAMLTRTRRADR